MRSDLIDITVRVKHRTDKAVLVSYDEDKESVWLPLSQIEIESNSDGRTHTASLPQRLAEEKEMV